ncbi:MAG: ABC transporter permease [Cyclobacteriaceae bacterium]|nr:ABC transporter permease [Cyclobacteriaceae bacterium]
MKVMPPRWADRFLEWYCNPDLLEEIQGDAYELFYRTANENTQKAKLSFIWNVLRFFRWRNIRKDRIKNYTPLSTMMIKSYFVTGYRNMLRNATTSVINILGLSVAIGCAVMIFILEDSYYNLDAMHKNGDRIGLIVNHVKEGDQQSLLARSPVPLAELLKENSALEHVVRAARSSASVRVGNNVFTESILFADPAFLDMFSFNVVSGNRQSLYNKNQLMLTREMAVKHFGNEDVVGQTLSMKFNNQYIQELFIGGVLENTPANSSMYFNFLVPSAVWEDMNKGGTEDWSKNLSVTFVMMKEGNAFSQLQPTFDVYQKFQQQANTTNPVQRVEVVPMKDVAQRSYEFTGSLSWSNAPAAMIAFVVIGIFLILLACFNYMNVAVASVSTRLKEIGVRKVVGGGKKEIIHQFLVENLLFCFIALLAGTALAYYFLVPGFDSLYPVKMVFEVSSWKIVILFFGGLLLFVALVSGGYPALYVSSFNAMKILRGKEKFGNKSLFSRTLLTLQFTLSITCIVGCLVFVWSSYYFEGKDWGYNRDETVVVRLLDPTQFEEMRGHLSTNKNVISYAGAAQHIGKSSQSAVIRHEEQEYTVDHLPVGFHYLESMNIRITDGRSFDEAIESDKHESVIVNQSFVKKMGWSSPINQSFELDSTKRYVIGVVADFYYHDFYYEVKPAMFTITSKDDFKFLVVKVEAGSVLSTQEELKKAWKEVAPDDPYFGFLQSEVFDNFLNSNRANNKVIYFISAVAVMLAAMGLYGLVSYNLTRRLKEFSVRKVFGASVVQLFRLMNRDYMWILVIAFVIGAPLGAFLMDLMLKAAYPEQIPTTIWPYVIAITLMVLTVGMTIATQLKRLIEENPTETLRSE